MSKGKVAKVEKKIDASPDEVWDALVTPEVISQYMFGAEVTSDWVVGSEITWKGEWQGKPYQDKGHILRLEPRRVLSYTHYSPLAGKPDLPENYHTVTIELDGREGTTDVTLEQDNNPTDEAREHSEQNWKTMLDGLKTVVEGGKPTG
jgi:uncharacterized protein YndB with AHSA1/START domain